jgi:putative zinc finger/helix-turn-helix YgiT family protein
LSARMAGAIGANMERPICTKCSKCKQRAVSFAVVPYEIQVDHDGRKYQVSISDLSVAKCSNCGKVYFDSAASNQVTRTLCKQAGLLSGDEIRRQREKLGLTQAALAELLDVEPREVAWLENGERIQQRHMDRTLRAFFALPELRATLADKQAIALSSVGHSERSSDVHVESPLHHFPVQS